MKARKSPLAAMVLADPAARHQLRQALARRSAANPAAAGPVTPATITFTDPKGRSRQVTAELMTPVYDGA